MFIKEYESKVINRDVTKQLIIKTFVNVSQRKRFNNGTHRNFKNRVNTLKLLESFQLYKLKFATLFCFYWCL